MHPLQNEETEALKQAQQEQVQAIEDQTKAIQVVAGPPIEAVEPPETLPSLEATSDDDQDSDIQSINSEISDAI